MRKADRWAKPGAGLTAIRRNVETMSGHPPSLTTPACRGREGSDQGGGTAPSMLALMQTPGKPHITYPAFWALMVGEGEDETGRSGAVSVGCWPELDGYERRLTPLSGHSGRQQKPRRSGVRASAIEGFLFLLCGTVFRLQVRDPPRAVPVKLQNRFFILRVGDHRLALRN